MSEEEKKAIDYCKYTVSLADRLDEVIINLRKEPVIKILNIIETQQKELDKEKEKNEELEMQLLEKDLHIDGLKEARRIAIEEIQEEYYISKDKIKEKIEELEKETKNTYIRGEKILVLQELLEEE